MPDVAEVPEVPELPDEPEVPEVPEVPELEALVFFLTTPPSSTNTLVLVLVCKLSNCTAFMPVV